VVKGGMIFGNNPEALAALVKRIRAATGHPLVVKLSPNVTDIVASAHAAVDSGADALSLINTLVGLAIDLERREPKIGFTTGGLSGPAIRPIALRMVWEVRKAIPKIPIFGMGGIETVEHVVEFLIAGANAVQIGTANFRDPSLASRLVGELATWCEDHGVARVSDLVDTLRTRPRPDHEFA
jgi:dihydroorotate dehydrogenase (NAD+) catalytic subunit